MLRTENRTTRQLLGWLLASGLLAPAAAWSYPFCNATSQTLSEEVRAADVALLVQRVLPPAPAAAADDDAATGDAATGDAGGVELFKVPGGDEFTTVEEFTEVPRLLLIVATLVAALVLLALLWMILARPNRRQGTS